VEAGAQLSLHAYVRVASALPSEPYTNAPSIVCHALQELKAEARGGTLPAATGAYTSAPQPLHAQERLPGTAAAAQPRQASVPPPRQQHMSTGVTAPMPRSPAIASWADEAEAAGDAWSAPHPRGGGGGSAMTPTQQQQQQQRGAAGLHEWGGIALDSAGRWERGHVIGGMRREQDRMRAQDDSAGGYDDYGGGGYGGYGGGGRGSGRRGRGGAEGHHASHGAGGRGYGGNASLARDPMDDGGRDEYEYGARGRGRGRGRGRAPREAGGAPATDSRTSGAADRTRGRGRGQSTADDSTPAEAGGYGSAMRILEGDDDDEYGTRRPRRVREPRTEPGADAGGETYGRGGGGGTGKRGVASTAPAGSDAAAAVSGDSETAPLVAEEDGWGSPKADKRGAVQEDAAPDTSSSMGNNGKGTPATATATDAGTATASSSSNLEPPEDGAARSVKAGGAADPSKCDGTTVTGVEHKKSAEPAAEAVEKESSNCPTLPTQEEAVTLDQKQQAGTAAGGIMGRVTGLLAGMGLGSKTDGATDIPTATSTKAVDATEPEAAVSVASLASDGAAAVAADAEPDGGAAAAVAVDDAGSPPATVVDPDSTPSVAAEGAATAPAGEVSPESAAAGGDQQRGNVPPDTAPAAPAIAAAGEGAAVEGCTSTAAGADG
jgi:hypothetical protein